MNTGKQINAMIAVLMLLLLLVGVYTIWDPFRAEATQKRTQEEIATRGAHTFAANCRLCHGNDGEGRIGPPLNPEVRAQNSSLVQFANPNALAENQRIVTDTITCGRVGTIMPPWSQTQGGSLTDEQIRQLVILITDPPPGVWEKVAEYSAEQNAIAPLPPITDTTAGAPLTGGTSRVCGQLAPKQEQQTGPVEVKSTWDEVTTDNKFSVTQMGIAPNQPATVNVRNNGTALHNWHVLNVKDSSGKDIVVPAQQFLTGGQSGSITFTISTPGTYNFQCDVHPTEMKGTLVVQEGNAPSPAASPGPSASPGASSAPGASPAPGSSAPPSTAPSASPAASPSPTPSP